jgi:3-deoxy-manno-octulosonate cytidylyltransferase (CMP-KDO synthetase)
VKKFGGRAVLTAKNHESGTARVAEIARRFDGDIFINIQGDEPLIDPATIEAVAETLVKEPKLEMASAKVALEDKEEIANPQVVKVVVNQNDYALYFSRSPIPYDRNGQAEYWKHLGIYAYRRDFLLEISAMPPTPLAAAESLEQLKVMENGRPIKVVTVPHDSIGVDTPADLEKVRAILKNQ